MTVVHENVWCGYRNKVQVINAKTMSIEVNYMLYQSIQLFIRNVQSCISNAKNIFSKFVIHNAIILPLKAIFYY